jgi:hypothetical protein
MKGYVVNWDEDTGGELDAVFSSLEKAKAYVEGEYERCEFGNPLWDEEWAPEHIEFSQGQIWLYEVDTLPYFLID